MRKHRKLLSIQIAAIFLLLSGCKNEAAMPDVKDTSKSEAMTLLQSSIGDAAISYSRGAEQVDPFRSPSTY